MTRDDLRPLLEFCDAPSLREKIQAAIDHGIDGGARHLGLNLRTYRKAIRGGGSLQIMTGQIPFPLLT